MKSKILSLILSSLIIVIVASCTKTDTEGPQGTAGPSYEGALSGNISLFDQYGTRILTGLAGFKVSVVELNKSVKTDSNGHYIINNVITGSYTVTVVDTTNVYASNEVMNAQYIVGNVNRDFKLSAIPVFTLASCTAVDTTVLGVAVVKIVCYASAADTRVRTTSIFLGADSLVTTNNYLLNYSNNIKANLAQYTLLVPVTDIYGAGLISGQRAYFSIYPAAADYATTSEYEQDITGRTIYNALGTVAVSGSAVVP